jgi:hypothetical protein
MTFPAFHGSTLTASFTAPPHAMNTSIPMTVAV